jgi:DNA-binding NarL/FixJ family response regulator
MIQILIADEHPVMRTGLRQILAAEFRDAQFGEAGTAAETLQLLRQHRWDVAVLEAALPGSGPELLQTVTRQAGDPPVLLMGHPRDEQQAQHTFAAGAAGYVTEDSSPQELVAAVKSLLAGGRYVTATVAGHWFTRLHRPAPAHGALSERELQVLRLIAAGKALKEIAHDLTLSVKTISTYRARILKKLTLHTNVDIARYALQHKLAE